MNTQHRNDPYDLTTDPTEYELRYFTGRREMLNPDTLFGTATEFKPGILHIRIDDQANDAFWLEFTLILSTNSDEAVATES